MTVQRALVASAFCLLPAFAHAATVDGTWSILGEISESGSALKGTLVVSTGTATLSWHQTRRNRFIGAASLACKVSGTNVGVVDCRVVDTTITSWADDRFDYQVVGDTMFAKGCDQNKLCYEFTAHRAAPPMKN